MPPFVFKNNKNYHYVENGYDFTFTVYCNACPGCIAIKDISLFSGTKTPDPSGFSASRFNGSSKPTLEELRKYFSDGREFST